MAAINRIVYQTLALVAFASLGILPQVQAGSPNNANATYNFNNSKFHGWWRNTMIGAMNGFDAGGSPSALQDQYIYIDTSVYPVKIWTPATRLRRGFGVASNAPLRDTHFR